MSKYLFTITEAHFRDRFKAVSPLDPFTMQIGKVRSAIGNVQKIDIGKRVYKVNGCTQVENCQQRDRRLGL